MNRREFLKRFTAAALLAGLDVPQDLEQLLPMDLPKLTPILIPGMEHDYRITFPDGTLWSFRGVVQAIINTDDEVHMEIQPLGAPKSHPHSSTPTQSRTRLRVQQPEGSWGEPIEIEELAMPMTSILLDATTHHGEPTLIQGIKKFGPLTITGKLND